jgi:hypothetical protein
VLWTYEINSTVSGHGPVWCGDFYKVLNKPN